MVRPATGRWYVAYSPIRRRSARAYEELIEAGFLGGGASDQSRPDLVATPSGGRLGVVRRSGRCCGGRGGMTSRRPLPCRWHFRWRRPDRWFSWVGSVLGVACVPADVVRVDAPVGCVVSGCSVEVELAGHDAHHSLSSPVQSSATWAFGDCVGGRRCWKSTGGSLLVGQRLDSASASRCARHRGGDGREPIPAPADTKASITSLRALSRGCPGTPQAHSRAPPRIPVRISSMIARAWASLLPATIMIARMS